MYIMHYELLYHLDNTRCRIMRTKGRMWSFGFIVNKIFLKQFSKIYANKGQSDVSGNAKNRDSAKILTPREWKTLTVSFRL